MDRNMIVLIVGVVLTLGGFVLVAVQMLSKKQPHGKRSGGLKIWGIEINLATTYPGLLVIALGIILLITSLLTWR